MILSIPLCGYWASKTQMGTAQQGAWLSDDDDTLSRYRAFQNDFDVGQPLLISWRGCTIEDARLAALTAELQTGLAEFGPLVRKVEHSGEFIRDLATSGIEISENQAARRLAGFAVGEDGSAIVVVSLGETTASELASIIRTVRSSALTTGVHPDELVLAGEPYQTYLIDTSTRDTVVYFVAPSTIAALLIAWICLRSGWITVVVLAFAGIGQLIGLTILAVALGEMSNVLVVVPTLVFMLTLSAAVHLACYHFTAGGHGYKLSGVRALQMGFAPCSLATLTTAMGFLSLAVSQLTPVWQFGSLAALGLAVSTVVLLAAFPAACSLRFIPVRPAEHDQAGAVPLLSQLTGRTTWYVVLLGKLTTNHSRLITVFALILLLVFGLGLINLQSSTRFEDMFPEDHAGAQSLTWIKHHLGPLDAFELLVTFNTEREERSEFLLSRLELLRRLHRRLESHPNVFATMSASTYLPAIPRGGGTGNTIRRAVLRRKIESRYEEIAQQGWLSFNESQESWRISVRVSESSDQDLSGLCSNIRSELEDEIADFNETNTGPADRAELEFTGLRLVGEMAQQRLLKDLGTSFITAFVIIAPVMMLIVRGFLSGLVVMIPSVIPVALVFGAMGWLSVRVDVASILTASVALGIAVDDTLHFMSWYLRTRQAGCSAKDSVRAAIAHCARPMLTTTLICTGAMLPFFFTDFLPTSRFALLMILILSGALVGDLLVLPAMLQRPALGFIGKPSGRGA